jgi:hypothetical protein
MEVVGTQGCAKEAEARRAAQRHDRTLMRLLRGDGAQHSPLHAATDFAANRHGASFNVWSCASIRRPRRGAREDVIRMRESGVYSGMTVG